MLKKLTKRAKTQQPKAAATVAKPAPAKKRSPKKLPTGLFSKVFAMGQRLSLRHRRRQKLASLRAQDEATRAARLEQFRRAQQVWVTNVNNATGAAARETPTQRTWEEPPTATELAPAPLPTNAVRPQQFVQPTPRRSYQTISVVQLD